MKFVQDMVTHREFLFTTWVTRLTPLTLAVVSAVLFYVVTVTSESRRPGSRLYFLQELRTLGPMIAVERWALLLFILATVLAFPRRVARVLPSFTPAYTFCRLALWRLPSGQGRTAADMGIRGGQMMWGLFYVFAGGNALGAVLKKAGAAEFLGGRILPYAALGPLFALVVFAAVTLAVAQIISNVATVAIMVPIAISVFRGLGAKIP